MMEVDREDRLGSLCNTRRVTREDGEGLQRRCGHLQESLFDVARIESGSLGIRTWTTAELILGFHSEEFASKSLQVHNLIVSLGQEIGKEDTTVSTRSFIVKLFVMFSLSRNASSACWYETATRLQYGYIIRQTRPE